MVTKAAVGDSCISSNSWIKHQRRITVKKKNTFLLFIKKLKPEFNQFNPAAAAAVVVTVAAVAATKNHKLLFCSWDNCISGNSWTKCLHRITVNKKNTFLLFIKKIEA